MLCLGPPRQLSHTGTWAPSREVAGSAVRDGSPSFWVKTTHLKTSSAWRARALPVLQDFLVRRAALAWLWETGISWVKVCSEPRGAGLDPRWRGGPDRLSASTLQPAFQSCCRVQAATMLPCLNVWPQMDASRRA